MNKFKSGIYKIVINDYYIYIGQSRDIKLRWKQHLNKLKQNKHRNIKFQNVYNKYSDNIKFQIIEECDVDKLDEREMYWIEQFNTYNSDRGLNLSIGGDNGRRKYKTREEAKVAALENTKRWYQNNKKEISEYNKQYHTQYYQDNKKEISVKSKQYYQDNKKELNVKSKQYYQDNKKELKERAKQWYQDIKKQKGILSCKEKFEKRYNLSRPLTNKEWDTWCNTKHKFKCYAIKFLQSLPNLTFTVPPKK